MKLIKHITIITLALLSFFACKKKEATPKNTNTISATTTGVSGGDYGTFVSAYNVTQFGSSFLLDSTINASFYDSQYAGHTTINAGTVSVNGFNLYTYPNNVYYSTNTINFNTLNWNITGNGTITAASFSYAPIHPSYTGFNTLPDTITKSTGANIIINGVLNTNEPVYLFITSSSNPTAVITKTIATTPTTVNISSTELAAFTPSNSILIKVELFNYSHITVSSKQYGINANRVFTKYSYLK